MSGRRRVRLVVGGRVQGVGFRRFVERHGRALGLDGWVRNRQDGTVEVLTEGDEAQLASLMRELRRGPPGAHVEDVTESPVADSAPLPPGFAVRGG